MAYLDAFLTAGFALFGAEPPDRQFVRFEWLDVRESSPHVGGGETRHSGEAVLIRSDAQLIHEHELAHAVHAMLLPQSNRFLNEGFAVMLDAKRTPLELDRWPAQASLDELLTKTEFTALDYATAWYLVSQIVREHGFDGLAEFWRSVPAGSSAQEVRDAYEALFSEPLETLIGPLVEDIDGQPHEMPRFSCSYTICVAPQRPFVDDAWQTEGPTGCEDDPLALGPDPRSQPWDLGDVYRMDAIELGDGARAIQQSPQVSAFLAPCGLNCDLVHGDGFPEGFALEGLSLAGSAWRVEPHVDRDRLDERPSTIDITRLP